MNNIGDNIKNQRNKKNITQQALADELFVTRQCVSRWEQGKTLPDIVTIEKLATVFSCSVNDLIDDNSVKAITIDQAIMNKKRIRIIWITLVSSISLIVSVALGILLFGDREDLPTLTIYVGYGYIESIDTENGLIGFENISGDTLLPTYDYVNDVAAIENNRGDDIEASDLNISDKVKIRYDENADFYDITVIDSPVGESLYGIYISGTGTDYSSVDMIRASLSGVNYFMRRQDGEEAIFTTGNYYNFSFENDGYYHEYIYDIYISLNPLYDDHAYEIGVITSNGLRITETIDLSNRQSEYTVTGAFVLESSEYDYADNVDMTCNIHVSWVYPYASIEIYEYDKNNVLVNEEIIETLSELRNFEAADTALCCLVKVNTLEISGSGTSENSQVYELLLGESLDLFQSDTYGFITSEPLTYD